MDLQEKIIQNIDWKAFYAKHLNKITVSGKEASALCPFHNDTHASFSANLSTGLWKCFACGESGNALTFLMKLLNIDSKTAIKELASEAGIELAQQKQESAKLSIEDYASAKKLPVDFLKSLGLKNGKTGIVIPYLDETGKPLAARQRYGISKSGPRFSWGRGSKVALYGLWMLDSFREKDFIILVEGESDAQTLWYHNIPALGVPGSSTFQPSWVQYFQGFRVFIHKEPDTGGEVFVKKICNSLTEGGFDGEVYEFSMLGAKDPSESYCSNPDGFINAWENSLKGARPLDYRSLSVKTEEVIPGAPVQLRMPPGWRVSDKGIFLLKDEGLVSICPVPILLSRRLRSIDTGEEKIELTYLRDGKWHNIVAQRSVVFQTRSITMLADRGLPVTSERAKHIVKYLGDLEAENLDTLQVVKSVEHMGWIAKDKFLPGLANDIVLDVPDGGASNIVTSYVEMGEFERWKEAVEKIRDYPVARLILAASFASPLLSILGHRVFIVHAWGPTRGGKTTALKAALSVWGNPEELLASFNATKVALERMAGLYADLPLAVDERQVVGDKQGLIEGLVYTLGMGRGKARGTKQGGLQNTASWRSIVLTTGEEPLSASTSQGGVMTRTLELWGKPIPDEKLAQSLHGILGRNYGFAGPAFISRLIKEIKDNPDAIGQDFDQLLDFLQERFPINSGSHISAVAVCCLADYYASQWIFGLNEDDAYSQSMDLATKILGQVEGESENDYANRAWEFICGWLASNKDKFSDNCIPPQYGFFSNQEQTFNILPIYLQKALSDMGFSERRVLRDLAEMGKIELELKGGKKRYKVCKYWRGSWQPFIVVRIQSETQGEVL